MDFKHFSIKEEEPLANDYTPPADTNEKEESPVSFFMQVKAFLTVKKLIIAGCVFAVSFGAFYHFVINNPVKALERAMKTTAADYDKVKNNPLLLERIQLPQLGSKSGIDFKLSINSISAKQGIPLFFLNDSRVEGNGVIDQEQKIFLAELAGFINSVNMINLSIKEEGGILSVKCPELYGQYITVDFNSISEDYGASAAARVLPYVSDFSGINEGMSSFPDTVNRIGKAYSDGAAKVQSILGYASEVMEFVTKNVSRGRKGQVEDYACKTYDVKYTVNPSRVILRGIATQIPLAGDDLLGAVESMYPAEDFYEEFGHVAALRSLFGSASDFTKFFGTEDDSITPVAAKYYVDGKNKIRQVTYTSGFVYNNEPVDIVIDIYYLGEKNVFDHVNVNAKIDFMNGAYGINTASKGTHTDTEIFRDNSEYKIYFTDKFSGLTKELTLTALSKFDSVDKTSEAEFRVGSNWSNNSYALGHKGVLEADKGDLKELYIHSPYYDISTSLQYEITALKSSPRLVWDPNQVEILKIGQIEFFKIAQEILFNLELMRKNILSLYGL